LPGAHGDAHGAVSLAQIGPKDIPAELAHHLRLFEPGDFFGHVVKVRDLPPGIDHKHPFGEMVQDVGVGEVQKF
jgi:hypothetical protein